jgi:hypothetical protein
MGSETKSQTGAGVTFWKIIRIPVVYLLAFFAPADVFRCRPTGGFCAASASCAQKDSCIDQRGGP